MNAKIVSERLFKQIRAGPVATAPGIAGPSAAMGIFGICQVVSVKGGNGCFCELSSCIGEGLVEHSVEHFRGLWNIVEHSCGTFCGTLQGVSLQGTHFLATPKESIPKNPFLRIVSFQSYHRIMIE